MRLFLNFLLTSPYYLLIFDGHHTRFSPSFVEMAQNGIFLPKGLTNAILYGMICYVVALAM
jgi:hypothetical protein